MCGVFRVGVFLVFLILVLSLLLYGGGLLWFSSVRSLVTGIFMFDNVSFYLVLLILLLGVYRKFYLSGVLNGEGVFYLFLRLLFSILRFCVGHSILFWCFYELSMLPLVYLIFLKSPYSERFLAGWYFLGYLLVTSLPLLLVLMYLSIVKDSFFFFKWGVSYVNFKVYLFVSFIFFTKVPLVPFHTWLPIVHAESTRIVSIFLSGYIMKLGLLGVLRCSYFIFDSKFIYYLLMCCLASVFFLLASCTELDGKRWLAMLRLAHIVVPLLGLFVRDWDSVNFSFIYCLGHGISAGLVFGLLWYFYEVSKTRNWLLLKSVIKSRGFTLFFVLRMLSLCSFPTTVQFFCEVSMVSMSSVGLSYVIFWVAYLFFGGLVPAVLCGHLLVRREWCDSVVRVNYRYSYFLVGLILWVFAGMFFM